MGFDAIKPQVAIDADGNAIGVWKEWDGSYWSICSNRYVPGSGWGKAKLIETVNQEADYPQIAVDADGHATTVWEQSRSIWSNRYIP